MKILLLTEASKKCFRCWKCPYLNVDSTSWMCLLFKSSTLQKVGRTNAKSSCASTLLFTGELGSDKSLQFPIIQTCLGVRKHLHGMITVRLMPG